MLLIIVLLGIYVLLRWNTVTSEDSFFIADQQLQRQFDSLKETSQEKKGNLKPFNPNFITDFKGYVLGMSPEEIDRLHAFRRQDRFLSSIKEFQEVTLVSDTLLQQISPFFQFPEWSRTTVKRSSFIDRGENNTTSSNIVVRDLNMALASDLERINGIGPVLSKRIVKFRDRLGGFMINEQLYDVYGLEPQVVERTLKLFQVHNAPEIEKININTATANELASLVYISHRVAKNMVRFREVNGIYKSFNVKQIVE